jgi:multiple sugar transport system permease protein
VSLFLNFKLLHWLNTYLPLTVPEWFAQGLRGAFFIFIFRQAFKSLPYELEEAARVDGAGPFQIFWRVMLPLVRPSIAVAVVFSVVWHWNDTFGPSNFLQENYKIWPLSMELQEFQNAVLSQNNQMAQAAQMMQQSGGTTSPNMVTAQDTGAIMAAVVLVILPPLLFYLLIQRTFVQGIERTGLIE